MPVQKKCEVCDKTFQRPPSQAKNARFCSIKCKRQWDSKHMPSFLGRHWSDTHKIRFAQSRKGVTTSLKGKKLSSERRAIISKYHADVSGEKNPRAKWIGMSEAEARSLFEDYKKCHQNCGIWAKSVGGTFSQIRNMFRKYFPHEYEDFIELKMDRKTPMYAIGAKFEYRVRDYYRKLGYFVLRSPRSAGYADLIAIKKGEILLVQCKIGGVLPLKEKDGLTALTESIGAKALLAYRGRAPKYDLVIEELYSGVPRVGETNARKALRKK